MVYRKFQGTCQGNRRTYPETTGISKKDCSCSLNPRAGIQFIIISFPDIHFPNRKLPDQSELQIQMTQEVQPIQGVIQV